MAENILDNAKAQQAAMMPIPDVLSTAIKQLAALKHFKDMIIKRYNKDNPLINIPYDEFTKTISDFYTDYVRNFDNHDPNKHSVIQDVYNWFYDAIMRKFGNDKFSQAIKDYEANAQKEAFANGRSTDIDAALRYARKNESLGSILDVPEGYDMDPLETMKMLQKLRSEINYLVDPYTKKGYEMVKAWIEMQDKNPNMFRPNGLQGPIRNRYFGLYRNPDSHRESVWDKNGKYMGRVEVPDDPVEAEMLMPKLMSNLYNLHDSWGYSSRIGDVIDMQRKLIAEGVNPALLGRTYLMDHSPTLDDYDRLVNDASETMENKPFKSDRYWYHAGGWQPHDVYQSPRYDRWE